MDEARARFHRVVFLRDGVETSLTFLGSVPAFKFMRTLHTRRKARIEAVPALDNHQMPAIADGSGDRPAGSVLLCPTGPRLRTWKARRARYTKAFPSFDKSVMRLPRSSVGFSSNAPLGALDAGAWEPDRSKVVAVHLSPEDGARWAQARFGRWADGEWHPNGSDEKR